MRVRIKFAKTETMRFTSHLDLHRTLERTFRRTQLPMQYSKGFNPRPRINLAAALPLGCTSQAELVDVWLTEEIQVKTLKSRLIQFQPPGIEFQDIEVIPTDAAKLQRSIQSAEYTVESDNIDAGLQKDVDRILSTKHIERERRGKVYDLRPLIHAIEITQATTGEKLIKMRLSAMEGATGRPDEVLNELGVPLSDARIERTLLILSEAN